MNEGRGGVRGHLQKSSASRVCDLFGTSSSCILPHSQHIQMRQISFTIVVWRVMYGGLFAFWFDGSIQLVSSNVG
jgi:hypothetical protein